MIIIPRKQFGYDIIKRRELHNLKKGWKQLAKRHFDELELGYDEFEGRICLMYKQVVLPRQIRRKSDTEKGTDYIAEYSKNNEWRGEQ